MVHSGNPDDQASQHWFVKDRPCLTNMISFYVKVFHLVVEGEAVDVALPAH